jgi:hypothetical protein
MTILPWLFFVATAFWFGRVAYRAGRNWGLWAVGGALLGLVVSTMTEGLAQATFIPLSDDAVVAFHVRLVALALVNVGVLGWLFTFRLHRRHFVFWRPGWHKAQPEDGKKFASTGAQPPKPHCNSESLPVSPKVK